jgi:hypothetical protein
VIDLKISKYQLVAIVAHKNQRSKEAKRKYLVEIVVTW